MIARAIIVALSSALSSLETTFYSFLDKSLSQGAGAPSARP
jgi:hypothetical protein